MKNILVLMGGISSERDISISSGKAISKGLKEAGYSVSEFIIDSPNIACDLNNYDLVFIALHGIFGEDGKIQKILDDLNIPYTGSSAESCKISFNKILTRELLLKNNIRVPKGIVVNDESYPNISYPLIIKPACEGSSVGCNFVKNKSEWHSAYKSTSSISKQILVEEFISGKEITVGIVGKKVLPVLEVIPFEGWYDFNSKYKSNNNKYVVPANLPQSVSKKLQIIALEVFNILGASGFGRIDFRLSDKNEPYVLELNSIPGFTKNSLLPKAANAAGISFSDLCSLIVKEKFN
tara:strand:+ start:1663 stop:2544 length:882 start_codon:yes stop_codon:yes gene_type:complete